MTNSCVCSPTVTLPSVSWPRISSRRPLVTHRPLPTDGGQLGDTDATYANFRRYDGIEQAARQLIAHLRTERGDRRPQNDNRPAPASRTLAEHPPGSAEQKGKVLGPDLDGQRGAVLVSGDEWDD